MGIVYQKNALPSSDYHSESLNLRKFTVLPVSFDKRLRSVTSISQRVEN